MSGDRPLAQCWHKPLHCINTGGGELVWLGFAARMETRRETEREREEALERSRNERKRKARERGREGEKERGHCGLRLKRSIQPFRYFCSSLPSLFSQTSQSVPRFSPFSIPFAGMPPSKNDPNGSRFPRVPPSYRRFTSLGDQPPPPVVSQAKVRGKGRKRKRKKKKKHVRSRRRIYRRRFSVKREFLWDGSRL